MNIHDLNIFTAVSRLGSLTRAARALSTVQSNVTTRIRLLEEELGGQLFHRRHHGVQLTRKGQDLLPYAQQIITLVDKAREAVSEEQEVHGVLRIGSLQTTASARLPELLKSYITKYNKVDIAVETGTTGELHGKVLACDIDGAFIAGPVDHPQLQAIPAFVEELVMLTPSGYRSVDEYLSKGPIPKVLVAKVGCSYRQQLERYLSSEGIAQLHEMEFGTIDGIIGCVGAGLGIAMLPKSAIARSSRHQEVRIHPLPKKISRVETLFITRRTQVRSSALERLIGVIEAHHQRPPRQSRIK
jgi:LysR family transcriptional regulator, cell division regulator